MIEPRTPGGRVLSLVIVHRDASTRLVVPHAGGPPLDLANAEGLDDQVAAHLRESIVHLFEDGLEDVPVAVFEALWAAPVPPAFSASLWLHAARPLILLGGCTIVAGSRVGYLKDCGLWVEPRCESDDAACDIA